MTAEEAKRTLRVFALAFVLVAISNVLKPLQLGGEQTGFVFFGQRLSGTANLITGPLFGLYLLVYAWGIWHLKRFALPLGHAYATYVVLNLILFYANNPMPPGIGYRIFSFVYAFVALGVAGGAAVLLTRHKELLT
ncbi:MAG: hypothetical protein NZ578_02735 [Candidatus Binatia bacterium]|nr:hypothetical protein [Candidatus Binatia bacterium]